MYTPCPCDDGSCRRTYRRSEGERESNEDKLADLLFALGVGSEVVNYRQVDERGRGRDVVSLETTMLQSFGTTVKT